MYSHGAYGRLESTMGRLVLDHAQQLVHHHQCGGSCANSYHTDKSKSDTRLTTQQSSNFRPTIKGGVGDSDL